MIRLTPVLSALLILAAAPAAAQDVELLGERYGTRPPQSYYDELARDPLAFQFMRGRTARLRARMAAEPGGLTRILGPRDGPVTGTVKIPVVLGLFSDSPESLKFTKEEITEAYFGSGPGTISAYCVAP